jgi:hypothetical protein
MLAQFLKDCCNQAEASRQFWQRPRHAVAQSHPVGVGMAATGSPALRSWRAWEAVAISSIAAAEKECRPGLTIYRPGTADHRGSEWTVLQ